MTAIDDCPHKRTTIDTRKDNNWMEPLTEQRQRCLDCGHQWPWRRA